MVGSEGEARMKQNGEEINEKSKWKGRGNLRK